MAVGWKFCRVRSLVGVRRQSVQRSPVPLLVIALELESQAHSVAHHLLVFVARGDSGEPFVERVAVARQAESKRVLLHGEPHRAGRAPSLLGIV